MNKKKKRRIGCFPFVMLICSLIIGGIAFVYLKDDNDYSKLKEEVINEDNKDDKNKKKKGFDVDWDKLPKNCYMWIKFKHPKKISYPVMHNSETNDYYLHKNIEGDYAYAGSIFIDYHNNTDLKDQNTIIYGHNMANGTMFGQLKKFNEESYWKKNQFFYLYHRNGKCYKYQIFNVVQVKPDSKIYVYKFGSPESMDKYIQKWKGEGEFDTGIEPTSTDHIVSLSTCSNYGTKRMVIQGMLVKTSEY